MHVAMVFVVWFPTATLLRWHAVQRECEALSGEHSPTGDAVSQFQTQPRPGLTSLIHDRAPAQFREWFPDQTKAFFHRPHYLSLLIVDPHNCQAHPAFRAKVSSFFSETGRWNQLDELPTLSVRGVLVSEFEAAKTEEPLDWSFLSQLKRLESLGISGVRFSDTDAARLGPRSRLRQFAYA